MAWLLFGLGTASLTASWYFGPSGASPFIVAILVVAVVVSENAALPLPGGGSTSLAHPIAIAAALLVGPLGAGVVILFSATNIQEIREKRSLAAVLGNAGQLLISYVLPAWLYLALGGRILLPASQRVPMTVDDFPQILLPLAVLGLGTHLINATLVSIGIGLLHGVSPLRVWRSDIAWTFPFYMSMVVLGIAVAQVLSIHPAAFVLLIFPLIVSRQVYQYYLGLKGMYLDTVRSLVAALEAKDPYTRGHSERVAKYAVGLAHRMGLPENRVEQLGLAAQLHDLGKVAIRSEVLQKSTGLTIEEYEEIQLHPEVGATIAEGVTALGELAEIVRYHHERYDGLGYAVGLAGEQIPLEARVLAIADSYDAMTTVRAYRDGMSPTEAVQEIISCAGTQFDPHLVEHFVESIQDGSIDE